MADPGVEVAREAWDTYLAQHETWEAERAESLVAEDGWLALIGLYWLNEGENHFGTGSDNELVFPAAPSLVSAPPRLGTITVSGLSAQLAPAPGSGLAANGTPIDPASTLDLTSDSDAEPTLISHGSVEFHLIERGETLALRLRDRLSAARLSFSGLTSYEPSAEWVIDGRFEPYDEVREVEVPNVTPLEYPGYSAGEVVLEIAGSEHRLIALSRDVAGPLFLVIGDATNGHATYGGGRYVYTAPPATDGSVRVDLNRLYNPPCVFTEWATCPLPPRQNRLEIPIEAGELDYQKPH